MPKPIDRDKIPWFPTINVGRCTGCRVCFEFCSLGVYSWDEDLNVAVVREPYRCVVGCNGCEERCPTGAIKFPDPVALRDIFRKLREDEG